MQTLSLIDAPLNQLEQADLVRRLQELEVVYQFKHTLVQESAYASLLRNDRRTLHLACAHALEETYADDLDKHASLLSRHYAEAGDEAKTYEYARRAGEAALRVHAQAEALMHFDTATLLAARLPLEADDIIALYKQRGRALELMGRYQDAVETYRALQNLSKKHKNSRMALAALLALATMLTFPNDSQDLEEALRLTDLALELARELNDKEAQVRILWNRQQHAYFTGHAEAAVAYSKQALALADQLGLREMRAYILNDASRALLSAESVPIALKALEESREIWRETNNLPMLVDNLSSTSETAHIRGEVDMAEQYALQAQELSQSIGNLWNLAYSSGTLLQIYALRGETARALTEAQRTKRLAKQSSFLVASLIADIESAAIWGELGEIDRGIELLTSQPTSQSFQFMEAWQVGAVVFLQLLKHDLVAARETLAHAMQIVRTDDLSTYGPIYVGLASGEMALQEGRYADALTYMLELAHRLRSLGIRFFLPETLWRQARAHIGRGETDDAVRVLQEGQEVARYMSSRPVLWQLLATQAELQAQLGHVEQANILRAEARETIEWLTAQAPAEFRALFRAQPHVCAVLES